MKSSRDDILDLFDYAWQRFRDRMASLGDDEWSWQPTKDDRISLRWRLWHIADTLREERNGPWLGTVPELAAAHPEATGAATALADVDDVDDAYAQWRGHLASVSEASLSERISPIAGPYGDDTRRSFALHTADELIHHAAEAALLRDLYAARRR
ncbi:MAG TPA: DinB family protein [Pseudonocardiaceae bacterium]|nr:DinB family protein [Pseudonocardiaceae bacterium]